MESQEIAEVAAELRCDVSIQLIQKPVSDLVVSPIAQTTIEPRLTTCQRNRSRLLDLCKIGLHKSGEVVDIAVGVDPHLCRGAFVIIASCDPADGPKSTAIGARAATRRSRYHRGNDVTAGAKAKILELGFADVTADDSVFPVVLESRELNTFSGIEDARRENRGVRSMNAAAL